MLCVVVNQTAGENNITLFSAEIFQFQAQLCLPVFLE